MRVLLSLLLLCTFSVLADGAAYTQIRISTSFPTIEAAIRHEVRAAMRTSANLRIEIGGVIYERSGNFYASTWVYGEAHSIPNFQVGLYSDTRVPAMWHTHPDPDTRRSDGFSSTDAKSAYTLKADAYVGVVTTDTIRVLRYADIERGEHNSFYAANGEVTSL